MVETRCCGDTTTSPEWRKDVELPVSVAQWGRSSLKLQVWNREAFVTDDFLGQVVLPLKDLLPQVRRPGGKLSTKDCEPQPKLVGGLAQPGDDTWGS